MRIGELEERTGLTRHTLRYYEREGLLPTPRRRRNNYRDYPARTVEDVLLIRRLKGLGFSLREIRPVLKAVRESRMDCAHAAELVAGKLAEVEEKIAQLREVRRILRREKTRLESYVDV